MKPVTLIIILLLIVAGGLTRFVRSQTGGGEIRYTDIRHDHKTMGDVTFSHDFHTQYAQLDCVTCHSSLFTMNRENFKAIKADNERVHAYFDKDQYCGHCHNNRTAFNTDNCNLCHEKAQGL